MELDNPDCGCSGNNNIEFDFSSNCGESSASIVSWNDIQDKPSCFTSCDTMVGEVKMIAFSSIPSGWLECDGSEKDRTIYSSLFARIGTTFGIGNGSTTFNLPDLRSRSPMGAGQGSGLSNRTLGTKIGSETDVQSHDHNATSDESLGPYTPAGNVTVDPFTITGNVTLSPYTPSGALTINDITVDFTNIDDHTDTISEAVPGHTHDVVLPAVTVEDDTEVPVEVVPDGTYTTTPTIVSIDLSTQPLEHTGDQVIPITGNFVGNASTQTANFTADPETATAGFTGTPTDFTHDHGITIDETEITTPIVHPVLVLKFIIKY